MKLSKYLDALYKKCPVFIQNFLISMYGYYWKNNRFGGVFKGQLGLFKERETFTSELWKKYQTKELRKLLLHAYSTVPYYHEKYTAHGFTKEVLQNFEIKDLPSLPYLEKEDLRKFGTTTLLSEKRAKGSFLKSSGSTGTPVSIYYSKEMHQTWSAAYETRVRNWAGVNYKMSRAMIGGRRILPEANAKPPYYRYNYAEKQIYFSAYHLSVETISNYIQGLIEHKVEYLVGYAMSIYLMAEYSLKAKLNVPELKAVLTSSEKLTDEMRVVIERVFKCKCYDGYSGVESCGLISENYAGELLFSPDTGIMEVIDENGKQVQPGQSGEVIATGLLNFDQPLIRYRIGDRVKLRKDQNTETGLAMPVIEDIEGRLEDVVTALDGRQMVRFHGVFLDIPGLIVTQLIQESLDLFVINLVVDSTYETRQESVMSSRLTSQVGEVKIKFQYLENIPRNKNGKFRSVISRVG